MTCRAVSAARVRRAVWIIVAAMSPAVASAQYEAPANYYSSITTQTGVALKNQLQTVMSTGHVQTNYGQARDYMAITDTTPGVGTQLQLFYTRAIVNKSSATQQGFINDPSGDATRQYNSREHVWPDSLQGPGDTVNTTFGSRGDINMLKPCEDGINNTRGNQYYVGATTTGAARNVSGGFYAGDADRGDAARIIFYAATRWQTGGGGTNGTATLNVKDGTSGDVEQMGDLNSLLHWHYLDTPDPFELRRNDVINRGDDTQTAGDDIAGWGGTGNRNAYIDRPEYAWSVYRNQANDAKLTLAAATTSDANGGSTKQVNLGRVLRGGTATSQTITLNKAGVDGTYYSVTAGGDVTSSVTGRYNAFAMDAAGSRAITVGIGPSATAGLKTGTITIDNLDVTAGGGAAAGANDGNDVANVSLSVLDVSNASFAGGVDANAITLDFGSVKQGTAATARAFSISNLAGTLGAALTAGLDLDSIVPGGNAAKFSTTLALFKALAVGDAKAFNASFDTSTLGTFGATYTLGFSDEDLPGTQATTSLTLNLAGTVVAAPEPASLLTFAIVGGTLLRRRRRVVA